MNEQLEAWVNLGIALIPSILIWVFKSGKKDQAALDLKEALDEFREENKEQAEAIRADFRTIRQEFRETTSDLHKLDVRVAGLETWKHVTNNRMQTLAGQVDDLRIRKN